MKSSLLGLLLVSSFGSALSAQTPKLSYDEHVAPILRERCFSCHNPDKKKGGLVLNTYGSMMAGGSSGAIVTPGDPDSSRFFLLVSHQEEPYMPPRSERLPQKELDVFRRWLAQGALENAKSKATIKKPRKNLAFKLQAVSGKRSGAMHIRTIHIHDMFRFIREVNELRNAGLHFISHLVLRDASQDFWIRIILVGKLVHMVDLVDHPFFLCAADTFGVRKV